MNSTNAQFSVFPDSKSHYDILDGLRGVAAVMVVIFHLFEAHANGSHIEQVINHGYLAVDFFYVLSGFVVGYAYDDRWGKMTLGGFFKRRLIRLHPMIIMGMIVGAVTFYFQDSGLFPGISEVPVWKMLLIMLIGFTLIPVPVSMDIRGWGEMHPLNGPGWSLFFEYVANILYAVVVRKFSNLALAVLVFISGTALVLLAAGGPSGDVIGGWSLDPQQFMIGLTRLMYPFFAGLLLSRMVKPTRVKHAFFWCSLLIIIILSFPRVGGADHLWMNGLYDSFSIIILFPLVVYLGASGSINGKWTSKISKFLGDISYPIYITHYPLIYIYTGWAIDKKMTMAEAWPVALLVWVLSISLAWASLKFFDVPVRNWLGNRYMKKPQVAKNG